MKTVNGEKVIRRPNMYTLYKIEYKAPFCEKRFVLINAQNITLAITEFQLALSPVNTILSIEEA